MAEWTTEDIRLGFAQSLMSRPFFYGGAEQIERAVPQFNDWLREVQADAWQVGSRDTHIFYGRLEDAEAAGQGHLVNRPENPYRKALHGRT